MSTPTDEPVRDATTWVFRALRLRADGSEEVAALDELAAPSDECPVWIDLDRTRAETRAWLSEQAGLDALAVGALLEEETRPRCEVFGEGDRAGVVLILRGVNLNPGADPEDMVAVRAWIDGRRLITLRMLRVMAVEDLREAVARPGEPSRVGSASAALAGALTQRMWPVLESIYDRLDRAETSEDQGARAELSALRREAAMLKRHLHPQRAALSGLESAGCGWLQDSDRAMLRETLNRVSRDVEDLEEVMVRASAALDGLVAASSERMTRVTYLLSIVAAVFLPLSFLTGLLGMNVGGLPGADRPWAFVAVCAVMLAVAAGLVWGFRRMRWL